MPPSHRPSSTLSSFLGRMQREVPTWLVAIAIYGGWLCLTWNHASVPLWLVPLLGGGLLAWHGSLQHETIHGHPTGIPSLDMAVGYPPLGLLTPYAVYRTSHLDHHEARSFTDPDVDPESFFLSPRDWQRLPTVVQSILILNNTLIGRMVLGPPLVAIGLFRTEIARLRRGDRRHFAPWLAHAVAVSVVLLWTRGVCGMGVLEYCLLHVWPGLSLTLVRSFAEHRPGAIRAEQSAIVESGPALSLLFLNNNLHAVHHAMPGLAWYQIPRVYRQRRESILKSNGGYFFGGYAELARKFALRPIAHPVHPRGTRG